MTNDTPRDLTDSPKADRKPKKGPYDERLANVDPIHQREDGTWWFYDETWIDTHGPYENRGEAERAINMYCKEVL